METMAQTTVGELAAKLPGATRVFERVGIDYCCRGGRTLEEACVDAGVSADALLDEIRGVPSEARIAPDFPSMTLRRLVDYIILTHHIFTSSELARLSLLLEKVRAKHEPNHPELASVAHAFVKLEADLIPHMAKEENVLFPYLADLERASEIGARRPRAPFGSVRNPVRMMMLEHDAAGDLLAQLRAVTGGFAAPPDACASFNALYDGLHYLERDLHQHIHLENNVLFPKAVALEEGLAED